MLHDALTPYHTHQVSYCGRLSPIQRVLFGMPQGSVLGPLLYVLYTAELELIVARHDLRIHMYADDCQVYLGTTVEDVPLAVSKFAACVTDINIVWTRRRHSCYGSARVSLWTGSTATTSWCSALVSPSRTPLATSMSSLTMSCRWQPMSRPSVAPVTTSYASSDQ